MSENLEVKFLFANHGDLTILKKAKGDRAEILRQYDQFVDLLKEVGIARPILAKTLNSFDGNTYIFSDFNCLYPWRAELL